MKWESPDNNGRERPDPHEVMMALYEKFGEECAARNIVPTYHLFEHWKDSDVRSSLALLGVAREN